MGDDPEMMCSGPMPFRLFVTMIGTLVHVGISYLAYYLYTNEKIGLDKDFFYCFKKSQSGKVVMATSRHLEEEYEMDQDLTIPRARVGGTGKGEGTYENNGFR